MIETKVTISFQMEITNVLNIGFIGGEIKKTGIFRKEARLQDKLALGKGLKEGDIVTVTIETIEEDEIGNDKEGNPTVFYRLINELTFFGFFTKSYTSKGERFKRFFKFEETGMVTLFEEQERFEVGDMLRITVQKQ